MKPLLTLVLAGAGPGAGAQSGALPGMLGTNALLIVNG